MKENKNKGLTIKCASEFVVTLNKFRLDFQEKHGVKISQEEATRLINKKIENSGGLIVD